MKNNLKKLLKYKLPLKLFRKTYNELISDAEK